MKNTRILARRFPLHLLPALGTSVLAFSSPWATAANPDSWNNFVGTNPWSVATNWLDLTAPLTNDPTADLTFGGAGAYTANNDLVGLLLNTLTLSSSAAATIIGNSLDFRLDDTPAGIFQNGAGAFSISNSLILSNPVTLGGTGTGLTTLSGSISGSGLLTKTGNGTFFLNNTASTFSSGTTVSGGVLEVSTSVVNGALDLSAAAATSVLGVGGTVTINGGELKLTQNGTGSILTGATAARPITFGATGGTLNINGRINNDAANTFSLILSPGGVTPVIKFNGGINGISSNNPTDGNWVIGASNSLKVATLTNASATTPLIFEITNGAMMDMVGSFNAFPAPLTLRGVSLAAGGDATGQGIDRTMGRFVWNAGAGTPATYTFNSGLFLEGAVQLVSANAIRRIDANITARGTASGNAAQVDFAGRATGTAIAAPQAFPLVIGSGTNNGRTITIENGGTVLFDNRNRTDQANQNGLQITALSDILGGGTLKIVQSWTGNGALDGVRPVGYVEFLGDIRGNGTAQEESVLEIQVPFRNGASPISNTGGVTFNSAGAAGADLIVNGSNAGEGGGLRITAAARNTRAYVANNGASQGLAFVDTGDDNLAKLNADFTNSIASPIRLAALTGSGGYLTIAPTGATFQFPAGGEWSNAVTVGLKVINNNPVGDDVSLAAPFQHNINVVSGATLNAGGQALGPFVATPGVGTIKGTGSITGGVVINPGGTLAPGFGVGTLTVGDITIDGALEIETTGTAVNDLLTIGGNLTLGSTSILRLPAGNIFGTTNITIATYSGALTGTFSSITGLIPEFSVNYGTGSNSIIQLIYTVIPSVTWNGNLSGNWSTNPADLNWVGPNSFTNTRKVVFDDTATGPNFTVNVTGGNVSPSEITINNTTRAYTIVSSAGATIIGAAKLTKSGTNTLTLSGPAAYTGGTQINAGTLRLGTSNALPDTGVVTVSAGATLDTQGNSDTIESLTVDGAAIGGGTLTIGTLNLGSGAGFSPNLVLNSTLTKNGAVGSTLTGTINLAGDTRAFDVAVGTAPELTINGVISDGSLTKTGNGTLLLGAVNSLGTVTVNRGTLRVGVLGAIPVGGNVTTGAGGTLDLNGLLHTFNLLANSGTTVTGGIPLTINMLEGANTGVLNMGGAQLTINGGGGAAYAGAITGTGTSVVKQGTEVATLTGASTYTGGLNITAGRVNASNSAGGTSGVTVQANTGLQLVGNFIGAVTVLGGTISSAADMTNAISGNFNISAPSIIHLFNEDNTGQTGDFAMQGTLRGTGNLDISIGAIAGADGGDGFRLRGAGASDYSGTITIGQQVKFELQSGTAGNFSPMGTGKIVATAGTVLGGLNGTYAQVQTRLTADNLSTSFGNSIEITGTGVVNFNIIGNANTTSIFGNLRIGDGQSAFFNKNDATIRTVVFPTVTLTGGTATFSVFDPSFGSTNATSIGPNVQLGAIGQTTPGSGVIFRGSAAGGATVIPNPHVTITGVSTYTGPTEIQTGILTVGVSGSLASSPEIILSGLTAKLDLLPFGAGGYAIPSTQKLSGIGDWDGRLGLSGTLAPGPSIGVLTGDDFTLNGGGTMQFELSTLDSISDQLILSGSFTKGTAGTYQFDFEGGGAFGQTYTLVTFISTTFSVADFSYIDLGAGLSGNFQLNANDLQFITIPEPASATTLAGGLALLAGLRRRRVAQARA
jgi:fibronectin-binding autotransporter adhesin